MNDFLSVENQNMLSKGRLAYRKAFQGPVPNLTWFTLRGHKTS